MSETGLTHDKVKDFLREGDDDAAGKGQKAVGTLRRVVALERETDLHNAPAEQDKTDGADESEDEVGQVVDYGNGVTCGKCRHAHAEHQCQTEHRRRIEAEASLYLARCFERVLVVLL